MYTFNNRGVEESGRPRRAHNSEIAGSNPASATKFDKYVMQIKRAITALITVLPILAMLGTAGMWIDTRYMHRQISDTRYIDLQIKIVQGHIRDYERLQDSGSLILAADRSNYETDMRQLDYLLRERNRMLGL